MYCCGTIHFGSNTFVYNTANMSTHTGRMWKYRTKAHTEDCLIATMQLHANADLKSKI